MCGIAGSFNRYEAFKLYQKNLERGRYSAGLHVVFEDGKDIWSQTKKSEKPFVLNDVPVGGVQYLLHSRAPTTDTKAYNPDDTHPFDAEGIIVAHNGIITNDLELRERFDIDLGLPHYSNVDSFTIPWLIERHAGVREKSVEAWSDRICRVLSLLRGTFGLWIHVSDINRTFICRSGSTLYADMKTGSFTSCETPGFMLLPEGVLYMIDKEQGIYKTGEFAHKPIYFIA